MANKQFTPISPTPVSCIICPVSPTSISPTLNIYLFPSSPTQFLAGLKEVQVELLHYPGIDGGGVGTDGGVGITKLLKFNVKVFKISYM